VHCPVPSATSIFHRHFQLPTPIWYASSLSYLPRSSSWAILTQNTSCGADLNDDRGAVIHYLSSRLISHFSTGANTHLCLATGTSSALDLTFCSPGLSTHLEWSVLCDLHSSDHFAVNVHIASSRLSESRHPNWILKKADWMGFTQSVQLDNAVFPDVDSVLDHFTNSVLQATAMNIPRSSIRPRRVPVPWCTDECRHAIRARQRELKQFQIHAIQENLVSFKRLRAAARRTIRSAKRRSWVAYVSSLSHSTPSDVVWQRLRRMPGKYRSTTVPGLSVNGVAITSQRDGANALVASFASASSSD
jgi:hypothetical protein